MILPKLSDVNRLKTEERKVLVDEGIKIARKVDGVREKLDKEQQALALFRKESVKKVTDEIDVLIARRQALEAQITAQEAYWDELLLPLDRQWILYVKTEKKKIDDGLADLLKEQQAIEAKNQQQDARDLELEKKYRTIEKYRLEALSLHNRAEQKERDATTALDRAQLQARDIRELASDVLTEAQHLKERAQNEAQESHIRTETLNDREKDLEDREQEVLVQKLLYYSPVKKN